ncbi:Ca2+ regulator and membrane fusion protein Fig1-domain-containing protein, partial [Pyronema domesticum]
MERKIKFVFAFQRLIPFLGYHHVLMVFILLAIILLSLLLAGCSSSSVLIPSIFLINLWYDRESPVFDPAQVDPNYARKIGDIVATAALEVRVGFFGICVNPDGSSWLCSANATSLAAQVNTNQDPLNLIWVSETFKESIVFPYLIIVAIILATVVLLLLATFPGYEDEYDDGPSVRRLPSRAVSQIALAIVFVASIFVLVSVLWQHTASVAAATIAGNMANGSVKTGVGVSAMVLGWFGFALLIMVTIGLLVMILSMHLVESLVETEEDSI